MDVRTVDAWVDARRRANEMLPVAAVGDCGLSDVSASQNFKNALDRLLLWRSNSPVSAATADSISVVMVERPTVVVDVAWV